MRLVNLAKHYVNDSCYFCSEVWMRHVASLKSRKPFRLILGYVESEEFLDDDDGEVVARCMEPANETSRQTNKDC